MRLSSQLKLRHLEVFVEVARQNSVTLAADALEMTQPAATRALRELETVCGKPLVERNGRGIRLTAYGEMFRDHAGRSLALARDGVAALRSMDETEGPKLVVGSLPTVSATIVPDAVARMRAEGGRNRITIQTGDNRYLLDQLRRGLLDLVVGRLPASDHMVGVDFDPLFRERVVAVVAADHPVARLSHLPTSVFEDYPVLLPSEGAIIRPMVDQMFLEQGMVPPRFPIETVSPTFGRQFTIAHQAIWFISQGVVQPDLAQGHLVRLPMNTDSTLGPVGLCIRSEHRLSPTAARFCKILREICEA